MRRPSSVAQRQAEAKESRTVRALAAFSEFFLVVCLTLGVGHIILVALQSPIDSVFFDRIEAWEVLA